MLKRRTTNKEGGRSYGMVLGAVLFCVMLVVLLVATTNLSSGADAEGANTMRTAIERAAVLCYATEGFYPPSLSYLEQYYGVQVDRVKYAVQYEVFAPNITPTIRVEARQA